METVTERSADGAVEIVYAPSGLTWRLTCAAANALEGGRNPSRRGKKKENNGVRSAGHAATRSRLRPARSKLRIIRVSVCIMVTLFDSPQHARGVPD